MQTTKTTKEKLVDNQKDIQNISSVIQTYVEGGRKGDIESSTLTTSPQLLNGTYSFVGNGLIMHNIENNPFWISYSVSYKEMKNPIINSYQECVNAGNPIMESYPRQCNTQDGKHFVEEIT